MNEKIKECTEYLETGGLGEVIGLTSLALSYGEEKIQNDTDLQMAILLLANEALEKRKERLN